MLRAFARQCALDVIHLWNAPQVVRDYLTTGDESLRDAAGNAAYAAVYAARAAVYAERAASYAAGAAASAARAAVYAAREASYAARDAAVYAARAAAKAAQRERFARLVADEFTNKENNDH